MTDTTNPRTELDDALAAMRRGYDLGAPTERLTMEATVVCAEALALLVDAHLPEPEPDPRESLPDDTPVGHGWVVGWGGDGLLKPDGNGRFTRWLDQVGEWGMPGAWPESYLVDPRPATVAALRRVGLPVTEWPDVTAPDPEPDSQQSRAETAEAELRARELHHFEAEQSEAKAIAERDNAITALRAIRNKLANLAAGHVEGSDDARGAYWESLYIVKTEARRRSLDLGKEVS